ncbi:hypothetical protein K438DRAFT_1893626 [Mycena galopus ATCC 62051]|nr:hypothetical protein K438DRAFT_1893626 [Mycena galopus ATCC 62051]
MSATTIFSLPNELLAAVAVAGQEDRAVDSYSRGSQWETALETFKPEWTLSHLCHRFRDVVVGTPALWTLIEADLVKEGSMEILQLYLERSRACKISTTIRESPNNDALDILLTGGSLIDAYDLLPTRVSQIVPHIHRIQRLRIVLRTGGLERLSPFRNVVAPQLQHLEIVAHSADSEDAIPLFSAGAPSLTFLKVDGLKFKSLMETLWLGSLTHLELRSYPGHAENDAPVAITAQCSLLVHLYVDIADTTSTQTARFHIPTLKFLHICITEDDSHCLLGIVDLFDTPALTEFTIDSTHGDQICVLFNLTSLPHLSFPALTSFCFAREDKCECESDGYTIYRPISSPPIALFPALSSLTLINQCFTDNLIRDILGPDSQPWPLLETVTVLQTSSSEGVRRTLMDAADSKRQRGHTFPKIRLGRSPPSLENWQDDLSALDIEMF